MVKILLLSIDHRIYKGGFYLAPTLELGKESLQAQGFKISGPVGTRPPFFIILLEDQVPGESDGSCFKNPEWHKLTEVMLKEIEIKDVYIELMLGGYRPEKNAFDVFYFGSGPQMAAKLAHLVIEGQKRGTATWIKSHEKAAAPGPKVGEISLATDGFGIPLCFIKTVHVDFIPFKEVIRSRLNYENSIKIPPENPKKEVCENGFKKSNKESSHRKYCAIWLKSEQLGNFRDTRHGFEIENR